MNMQQMTNRVKGILLEPRPEWGKIQAEQTSNKELMLYYALPFTAVAALISLIAVWAHTYLGFGLALRFAVMQLLLPIVSIIIAAVVINELAQTFHSTKHLNNAFKLVTYAYTPVLLINIIASISWAFGWLNILGLLYGIYLFWLGLPVMMETPENKRLVYIIAAVVVILLVNLIIGALLGSNRLGYY